MTPRNFEQLKAETNSSQVESCHGSCRSNGPSTSAAIVWRTLATSTTPLLDLHYEQTFVLSLRFLVSFNDLLVIGNEIQASAVNQKSFV